jgi:PPK2 family polyphosphate:nucleotide phosphotransferase
LKDYATNDTGEVKNEKHAKKIIDDRAGLLTNLQEKLYAQDRWALLLVIQAMDAAGKDGVIKHVMSGVNPQGCDVHSFKTPSTEELNHDYLWRAHSRVPERGMIGIFNRSYYEEVLVVRVHPELITAQRIPGAELNDDFWADRFADINAFEQHLTRNGTVILKFFLHLSKGEQRKRFLKRLKDPTKQWKFSADDLKERAYWDDYMTAFENAINATSTKWAPWHIIPADHKWVSRALVAGIIIKAAEALDLDYPKVTKEQRAILAEAKKQLESEA